MISVIMPVFNGLKYLKKSIDSVLNQTYSDFEFIIIDDCSTENVWDFLNSYKDSRMVLKRNKNNIGLTRSLNIALDLSKGDFIARQDGDDISLSTRFEEELKMFSDNVGLTSCWGRSIDGKGKYISDSDLEHKIREVSDDFIKKEVRDKGNFYILGPAAMYSRKAFETIGYYDESLYFSQDRNYWIRILQFFDVRITRKDLYLFRRHNGSVTHVRKEMNRGIVGKDRKKMVLEKANNNPIILRSQIEAFTIEC